MEVRQPWVDRILGYGGIVLAIVAVALTISALQTASSASSADWQEAAVGLLGMVTLAWMVTITVRHLHVYDKGGGRDLLIAGWASIPVIAGLVLLFGDLSSSSSGFGEWLVDLLRSPQAYVMLLGVPLMLVSVAILIDGVDRGSREAGKVSGTYGWYEPTP
ncbi:MAG: hypothetical protein ABFS21_02410 [Actinomycetota bacterium]